MKNLLLIGWLLIFEINTPYAQVSPYKCYTAEDGLANSFVYRICKDKQNLLWLSTNYGLSCFNGYTFSNFYPDSFNHSVLIGICCDKNNRIWAAEYHSTNKKIFCIDHGRIVKLLFKKDTNYPLLVTDAVADECNRIWLLNKDHKVGYINEQKKFVPQPLTDGDGKQLYVTKVYPNKDSSVLLATTNGIYRLNKDDHLGLFTKNLSKAVVYCIAQDIHGNYYFGSNGKVFTCNANGQNCDSLSIGGKRPVRNLVINKAGEIWYSSDAGYSVIRQRQIYDYSKSTSLSNIFINDMYCDGDVIFLGTGGKGLFRFYNNDVKFYDERSGLRNTLISCIKKNNAQIYVGSFGGVFEYKNDKFFRLDKIDIPVSDKVNDILFTGDNMWVLTPFSLWRYNLKANTSTKYSAGGMCLSESMNGTILIGGYDRVFDLDYKTGVISELKTPVSGFRTFKILHTQTSGYWFATTKGILNNKQGVWIHYNKSNSPINAPALDMIFDSLENIWMATVMGLYKLNHNKKWETYDCKTSMPNADCDHLYIHDGILYVGTARGIVAYDGKVFKSYGSGYGLPVENVNVQLYDSIKNCFWIASGKGVYQWYQRNKQSDSFMADVVVVRVEGSARKIVTQKDTVTLHKKDNHVSFDFFSPNYAMPENVIYAYRLLGSSSSAFIETGNTNLHFSSLSPGIYTLEIIAKLKNSSVAVSRPTTITIIVLKPLWQEGWFLSIATIFAVLIAIFGINRRIQFIKAREQKKAQRYTRLLQLKQEATNALISPHFIFNCLNSIQHFINKSDGTSANMFLAQFASLIRATMENVSNANVKLSTEVSILEKYLLLEAMRLPQLTYEINIDESLDAEEILIPSMLIQPYAENAIWHGITPNGGVGNLKINFESAAVPYLRIVIEDNGIGINTSMFKKKQQSRKSLGLEISKRRIAILEKLTGHKIGCDIKQLYDDNNQPCGTIVTLTIPFKKN